MNTDHRQCPKYYPCLRMCGGVEKTETTEVGAVTSSKHIRHARVMELYLEVVTAIAKNC